MSNTPLRGVNLGGWLIHEKWMTPQVFAGTDAVDEYTLSHTEKGRAAIEAHRKSFMQESDFKWLKEHGIHVVRVPVGYWLFNGEDGYFPHVDLLDWVMDMAKKYDIEVLIDLHGLKGSQNGYDHSGRIGPKDWFRYKAYRDESVDVLEKIARRYADHPKFWGLQLINEPPIKLFNCKLRKFYKQAAKRLQGVLHSHTRVVFSDSFSPRLMSGAVPKSARPVMDIHIYQPFRPWIKFVSLGFFMKWLHWQQRVIKRLSKRQPIIIGEWSGVIRQEDLDEIPKDKQDAFVKDYIKTQESVFQDAEAWFYWNYKTEGPGTWNYRSLVENGQSSRLI